MKVFERIDEKANFMEAMFPGHVQIDKKEVEECLIMISSDPEITKDSDYLISVMDNDTRNYKEFIAKKVPYTKAKLISYIMLTNWGKSYSKDFPGAIELIVDRMIKAAEKFVDGTKVKFENNKFIKS